MTETETRTFLTPLEFAAFLEGSRKAGPVELVEHAAAALMGLSDLRVAEMCSLRVESLSQDGALSAAGAPPVDLVGPERFAAFRRFTRRRAGTSR